MLYIRSRTHSQCSSTMICVMLYVPGTGMVFTAVITPNSCDYCCSFAATAADAGDGALYSCCSLYIYCCCCCSWCSCCCSVVLICYWNHIIMPVEFYVWWDCDTKKELFCYVLVMLYKKSKWIIFTGYTLNLKMYTSIYESHCQPNSLKKEVLLK